LWFAHDRGARPAFGATGSTCYTDCHASIVVADANHAANFHEHSRDEHTT
jgi:hypothetical protein